MLIDTDILIWFLKGNEKAKKFIRKQDSFFISVISYMELIQGVQNKHELLELRKALKEWNAKILYLNEEISMKALFYVERYSLSHSLGLADALIASTSTVYGMIFHTANVKHFKMISQMEIHRFRP